MRRSAQHTYNNATHHGANAYADKHNSATTNSSAATRQALLGAQHSDGAQQQADEEEGSHERAAVALGNNSKANHHNFTLVPSSRLEPTDAPLTTTEHVDGSHGTYHRLAGLALTGVFVLFPTGVYYGCYVRQNCDAGGFADYSTSGLIGAIISCVIVTTLFLLLVWSYMMASRTPPGPPPTFFRKTYFDETARRACILECRRREHRILVDLAHQAAAEEQQERAMMGTGTGTATLPNPSACTTASPLQPASPQDGQPQQEQQPPLPSAATITDLLRRLPLMEVDPAAPCVPLHRLSTTSEQRPAWGDPHSAVHRKLVHPRYYELYKQQQQYLQQRMQPQQQQHTSLAAQYRQQQQWQQQQQRGGGGVTPAAAASAGVPLPPTLSARALLAAALYTDEELYICKTEDSRSPNANAEGGPSTVPTSSSTVATTMVIDQQLFFTSDFGTAGGGGGGMNMTQAMGASECVPCTEAERCAGRAMEGKLYYVTSSAATKAISSSSPSCRIGGGNKSEDKLSNDQTRLLQRYGGRAIEHVPPTLNDAAHNFVPADGVDVDDDTGERGDMLVTHTGADGDNDGEEDQKEGVGKARDGNNQNTAASPPPLLAGAVIKWGEVHHCRSCRQCVNALDHHCPWLGQCIGRENHKFFIQFLGYTSVSAAVAMASMGRDLFTGTGNIGIGLSITEPSDGRPSSVNACTWLMMIAFVFEGMFFLMLFPFFFSSISAAARGDTKLEGMIRARNAVRARAFAAAEAANAAAGGGGGIERGAAASPSQLPQRPLIGGDGADLWDEPEIDTVAEFQRRGGGGTALRSYSQSGAMAVDGQHATVDMSLGGVEGTTTTSANAPATPEWRANLSRIFGPPRLQRFGVFSWLLPTVPILDMRAEYFRWRRLISDNVTQRLTFRHR